MNYTRTAVSPALPIPLEKVKERLQIEDGDMDQAGIDAQNEAVEAALLSAVEFVEKQTHLTLRPTTFRVDMRDWCISQDCGCAGERYRWSGCSPALLERVPFRDVVSIDYLGQGEITLQDLDPADYRAQRLPTGGLIHLNEDFRLPDLGRAFDAVQITFRAGYDSPEETGSGDDPDLRLPHALANALVLLTGYWFNNRDAVGTERVYALEMGAESLMTAFRLYK